MSVHKYKVNKMTDIMPSSIRESASPLPLPFSTLLLFQCDDDLTVQNDEDIDLVNKISSPFKTLV